MLKFSFKNAVIFFCNQGGGFLFLLRKERTKHCLSKNAVETFEKQREKYSHGLLLQATSTSCSQVGPVSISKWSKNQIFLANKEKLLISLNLCQNILCSIDQRNTHSMQTCSTSKKECFSWHRAYLLFSCIAAWLFPPVNRDPCKNVLLPSDSVSVFLLFATGTGMYLHTFTLRYNY